jgi:glycosyltransferase involved in cell wall biosynthesis
MKALILTYYFPPSGGSGVQRWLKFVKYLPKFGVEPIVYTVKNANYPIIDKSLEKEIPKGITILKQPIFEPNNFFKNKKESAGFLNSNPSFIGKIMQYIRANYFIPDARKYWVKPSVKYLKKYLKENKIDVIITTGPPHSVHVIGLKLKQHFPKIKWLADFRDPWTDIDYFHQLPLTNKAKNKHFNLEKLVLQTANQVIVVGKTMQENYLKFNKNTHVITNGFDTFKTNYVLLDRKFSLLHIGMLNNDRNHKMLWEVLKEISTENKQFKNNLEIKLIGKVCKEAINDIDKNGLKNNLTHIDYIKHNKVIKHQKSAQVLLLLINKVPSAKGIITGKVFEYLQAERPILAIAPTNGDLSEILINTNAGFIIDFKDKKNLKELVLEMYERYKSDNLANDNKNVEQYHRKVLTEKLVKIINSN